MKFDKASWDKAISTCNDVSSFLSEAGSNLATSGLGSATQTDSAVSEAASKIEELASTAITSLQNGVSSEAQFYGTITSSYTTTEEASQSIAKDLSERMDWNKE